MPALIALALSVGVLAALDTLLFIGPLGDFLPGLVWISFIAWGCHFHAGCGIRGGFTAICGMSVGALVGMVAIILAGGALADFGDFVALPVAVGLGAAVICLASAIPLRAAAPIGAYGFAAVIGTALLAEMSPAEAILPTVGSIVIGAVFGYFSELLANALTRKKVATVEATADPA